MNGVSVETMIELTLEPEYDISKEFLEHLTDILVTRLSLSLSWCNMYFRQNYLLED